MTIDDLSEKQQRDFDAAIKEHYEKQKAGPKSVVRTGPNATLQSIAEPMFLAAYRRVRNNRGYAAATDPEARLEGGALGVEAKKARANLTPVIDVIASVVPGWLQERPSDDAGTIPELPIDRVTGLRVRNPWLEPHDFKSQHVIKELSPRLARWLEDCAKHGGPTMAMLDELEAERIEAEHLRKLPYGEKEWEANLLRPGSGASLTEQNQFVKSIEDPYLLKFHRREAEMGSPRLKFDNLTVRMALAKRSPEVRAIHKAAGELLKSWQQEERDKAA